MTRSRERALLILLSAVQFTHVLDFMVMLPLGPQLMRDLSISPTEFSALVSVYSLFSGIVGFLATGYIDRHERRGLLLVTYVGFIAGTVACALSHTATALAVSRAVCGAFGGICGSMVMTVASDIVPPERRAAGLGLVTTSFSVSLAAGVPLGLYLATRINWEAPFWFVSALSVVNFGLILRFLPEMRGHIHPAHGSALAPLLEVLRDSNARRALLFFGTLVFAHFTIVPMLAPYLIANAGFPEDRLFLLYLVGGILSVVTTPWIGRLADTHGRPRVYALLVGIAVPVTLGITHAGHLPSVAVVALGASFFVFASGRFIPAQAICSLAVHPRRRGAFMSLNSCGRDLMAGITATLGGWLVKVGPDGRIDGYNRLGWIAVFAALVTVWLAYRVRHVEASRNTPS
jgi:MFS transporter, DHA1 family, inner membrane transport protein